MGLIWRTYQQAQISAATHRADSLDGRVRDLEQRLAIQEAALRRVIDRLERQAGEDISGDGRIGLSEPPLG